MMKNIFGGPFTPHPLTRRGVPNPSPLTHQPEALPVNAKLVNTQVSLISTPSPLTLVLKRTMVRGEYTHGHLSIDGMRICDTLENTNGQVPAGTYPIRFAKCKQYSRKMLLLNPKTPCLKCPKLKFVCMNSTMPCHCPVIKPGNGVHNRLDGSIIVGQYNCLGSIIHPKAIFDTLCERTRKSISRGHEVILVIKDSPSPLTSNPSPLFFV